MNRFDLGQTVATPGALAAMEASGESVSTYLSRHVSGDWGTVDADDARENEYAVILKMRILSAYTLSSGVRVWVITESDRSSTCVLLPEEY
jgi:hypothetical protein